MSLSQRCAFEPVPRLELHPVLLFKKILLSSRKIKKKTAPDQRSGFFAWFFIVSFLALYCGVVGVRIMQYAKTYDSKWIRLMLYVFGLILIATVVAIMIMIIYEGRI